MSSIYWSTHPFILPSMNLSLSLSLSLCITEIPSIFSPLVMGKPWKSPLIDVFPIKSSIVHGQPWLPEGSELGQWRCMYWPGKAQNNEQWTILAEDSRKNKYLINLINLIKFILAICDKTSLHLLTFHDIKHLNSKRTAILWRSLLWKLFPHATP